jgi:hypothetical protein
MRSATILMVGLSAVLGAGCAETADLERAEPALIAAVQVSKLEPQAACRALGAVDARSSDEATSMYSSAYETLRATAAVRGANYVVIDSITGPHVWAAYDPTMTIHGRLFACAPIGVYAQPAACSGACNEPSCR